MTLRLAGSTSGYTELDAPAVAGNNTLVFPAGNGNADEVLGGNGAGTLSWVARARMVQATAQASTSGTSIDFTGLPSWVKRVTVSLSGVSLSGTATPRLQIGPSGGVETSGYAGTTGFLQNASTSGAAVFSAGFDLISTSITAANLYHGAIVLTQLEASTNTWSAAGVVAMSNSAVPAMIGGSKALAGALSIVRLTSSNGTDTFDAGKVNILYEG